MTPNAYDDDDLFVEEQSDGRTVSQRRESVERDSILIYTKTSGLLKTDAFELLNDTRLDELIVLVSNPCHAASNEVMNDTFDMSELNLVVAEYVFTQVIHRMIIG